MPSQGDEYLLGRSEAEQARLLKQVAELASEAEWLLDRLQVRPGASAIDLGCGPQGVLELLARRVGPQGKVVGLERSADFVAAARKFVAERRLTNVEVVQGDAKATGLPRASFDVVFARLVMVNVPEPEKVADEMVALARPGGVIASHEADFVSHICDPPLPAWDRLLQIFERHSQAPGIDLFAGRKTHRWLREAGLVDVQVHPVIHVYPHGHNRRTILLDFVQNVRDSVLQAGLVTERELRDLMEQVRTHIDNPGTLVVSHLFFQAWGRKPGG